MGKVILAIVLLQVILITLALIFAIPVGAWVVAEFSLTVTSPILHFMIGALFFWAAGNIVSSILGTILVVIMWLIFWKDWRNI
jgi:hypothetical protein